MKKQRDQFNSMAVCNSHDDQDKDQWDNVREELQLHGTADEFTEEQSSGGSYAEVIQENPLLQKMKVESKILVEFPYGLPGFESLMKFMIIELKDYSPFHIMQSLEKPNISMIIIDPGILKINGLIKIPSKVLKKLHVQNVHDICLFVILRMDEKSHSFIANIRAPLVINTKNKIGHQIILEDERTPISYPLTL